jgi:peptide/nickel transport system substrate-binding protein
VANSLSSTVSRIDPTTLRVRATISVAGDPEEIAADERSVWVADESAGSILRIDATRNSVSRTVALGGMPTSLVTVGARVWAGVAAGGGAHRGGTMVIDAVGPFPSIDPAFFRFETTPQYLGLVYDTLVTFDHAGGANGLRLVPDLALNLPAPTDGGRTYAFRLRPGIRYSDGVSLRATDVRRAFERLFRVGSPGASYYQAIVGAQGCIRRPAGCDLSRGIVTDDAVGSVVFHLTTPDPEFLDALTEEDYTAPVPAGTPGHDMGLHPFPGTGPYRIARSSEYYTEFVRNPYFHEWSHAAQPAGYPDVIEWRVFNSNQAAADAVVRGHADWLQGVPPLSVYQGLALQSPSRLHSEPLFMVAFFSLNTHLAPFNNVLVRRALNLAIDRNRITVKWGGGAFATPICQPLAPGLPGFRRYCPYTAHPDPAGTYTGPNVVLARRLVGRSGTSGEHITVWGIPVGPYPPPQVSAYVASVLRSLGYHTTVRLIPFQNITNAMQTGFQISTDGDWQADYPDPSSYLPEFFACNGSASNGYVCDPALDREMERAAALEQQDPTVANDLWSRVDQTITDQADWVPTINNRSVDLVSLRLSNYQFNPVWGFLPDQAWVR